MSNTVLILQTLANGIGLGLVYGLVGLGFSVIYNASGIVNFAQGVFVMLGGMITHSLLTKLGLPLLLAAAIAVVAVAIVGMSLELLIVRPMVARGTPLYGIILATLAWQIMIERLTILTAGDQPRTYDAFTPGGPLKLGEVAISYQLFWVLGCCASLSLVLWLFFTRTRTGCALRACSQNPEAAALLGIHVRRMVLISFALSAAVGAVAGILITPMQYTAFNVDATFGINGFIAAIIGGFGSAPAALLGGLLLGVAQALAIVTFGAGAKNIAALSIMLLVLLFFPRGLVPSSTQ